MASLTVRRMSDGSGDDAATLIGRRATGTTAAAAAIDSTSADDESDEAEWTGDDDTNTNTADIAASSASDDDSARDAMDVSISSASSSANENDAENDDFEARPSQRRRRLHQLNPRSRIDDALVTASNSIASFFAPAAVAAAGSKRKGGGSERAERLQNRRRKIADVIDDDNDLETSTRRARQAERERQSSAIDFETLDDAAIVVEPSEAEPLVCLNVLADGSVPSGATDAETPVFVHASVSNKLKKHQIAGARFLWSHIAVEPHGFGCVLADFMGLGKTLQVLTVVHAFLSLRTSRAADSVDLHAPQSVKRARYKHVLILAPTICVRNWEAEVVKWFGQREARRLGLCTLESSREKKMLDRVHVVRKWHRKGGLLIMGYELYRLLVLQASGDEKIAPSNQKVAHAIQSVYKMLANPGPDLIVLDEGHRVRDHKSKLVKALSHVQTSRRIILTGYPLQNHLEEYWTMVNFARPDFLGTLDEFKNRFVDPIKNGQCVDSSPADLRLARQRAYVLSRELKPLVLRRDQQYLFSQLPPKKEFVLICKLTDAQTELYRTFLQHGVPTRGSAAAPSPEPKIDVLGGYHIAMAIANHPDVLHESFHTLEAEMLKHPSKFMNGKRGDDAFAMNGETFDNDMEVEVPLPVRKPVAARDSDADDDDVDQLLDALAAPRATGLKPHSVLMATTSGMQHRLTFAGPFLSTYEPQQVDASGKMVILMALLRECRALHDRVILFSQSIPTLNTIEKLLAQANRSTRKHAERLTHLRIDGSTPQHERFRMIEAFNDLDEDVDVILISTKAGGEGINLCGGNRIVIFDVCWNPCNDAQSMCRSYRFGQVKPVFVYRFVTGGTMEKKVYDLQIRKEGVAKRIVDDKTTERKFRNADLAKYFSVDDFEQSLKQKQVQQTDSIESAHASADSVLTSLLTTFDKLRVRDDDGNENETTTTMTTTTGRPHDSWIVEWFEQETMFEEDLEQQCSPLEAQESMEIHLYTKAVRRLRNSTASHVIERTGVLFAVCPHCRVQNEVFPTATTGVPVPQNLECSYCKRLVPTANATATPVQMAPGLPHGVVNRSMFPITSTGAMAVDATGAPNPTSRVLPPHMAALYYQQQQQQFQQQAIAAQRQRELVRQQELQATQRDQQRQLTERRRIERQSLAFSDRCLLVLRRGIVGCQALKRQAEDCGATIAIEVNALTTDIVSAMALDETLAFLKLTKLPKDVELRDDVWLRSAIHAAHVVKNGRGGERTSGMEETPAMVVLGGGRSSSERPAAAVVASRSTRIEDNSNSNSSNNETVADAASPLQEHVMASPLTTTTAADTSSDTIELLDSDTEDNDKDVAPAARATAQLDAKARDSSSATMLLPRVGAARIQDDGDDDDDVIEIM